MKIRFYHWWVYRLFYWMWSPILNERPEMVRGMRDWMDGWLYKQNKVIDTEHKEEAE